MIKEAAGSATPFLLSQEALNHAADCCFSSIVMHPSFPREAAEIGAVGLQPWSSLGAEAESEIDSCTQKARKG